MKNQLTRRRFLSAALVLAFSAVWRPLCAAVVSPPLTVGIAETCRGAKNDYVTADALAAAAFTRSGAVAFVIPRTVDAGAVDRAVSRIDALVLSGGEDVAPGRYGEDPDPKLEKVNPERDAFEIALLDAAARRGIPVFGICRGSQLINVYHGGTLHQDIGGVVSDASVHRDRNIPRSYVRHGVETVEGSLIARLAGNRFEVNSLHHQAVRKTAPGFRVTAVSPDGIVEAIESDRCFGVQFHPERLVAPSDPEFSRRFFDGLLDWIASFRRENRSRRGADVKSPR